MTTITCSATDSKGAMSVITTTASITFGPFAPQTGDFNIAWDAVPTLSSDDAVTGLSFNAPSSATSFACLIRFSTTATIDVRNGGSYTSTIAYTAGTLYHFRLVVRISTHTYDVYVTPAGSSESLIANAFAFRTEQSGVSTLNYLGKVLFTGDVTLSNLTGPTPFGGGSTTAPTITNARTVSSQNTLFNIATAGTTLSSNLNIFGTSSYAASTITFYVGGVSNGTTTTDGSGNWVYSPGVLADGAKSFTATVTSGGVASSQSSAYTLTINPGITSVSNTHSGTNTVGSNLWYQATLTWGGLNFRTESENAFANANCCIFVNTHQLDFTLLHTDNTPAQGSGQRSEILETGTHADGVTLNASYEFMLSATSPTNDCWSGGPIGSDSWSVIGQYHDSGSGPPVHENLLGSASGGDTFNVWYNTATAIAYAGTSNISRGTWHTVDVIMKPTSSGTGSILQIWFDGTQVVNLTNLHGTTPYYWKMGWYRGPAPPGPDQDQTIRYRNFLSVLT